MVEFKNSATAFNGEKKSEIAGKGALNNQITSLIFKKLEEENIPSHFIEKISEREQLVKKVQLFRLKWLFVIQLQVVFRNA